MSAKNRGDRIQLLVKVVNKHFAPVLAPSDRTLLEHMLYACCLENASYEAADEAFHRLQESFFDWNEVRVTTVTELMDHLHNLPDPKAAAVRVKKNLQSIFETRYSFDLQDMVKMNQGKAIAELEKLAGMTRFVLAYVTQNALAGHAIPVSQSIMQVLIATEVVTEAEASKGQTPGLDRSVPKSKGAEFSSCLHQLGLMLSQSPKGKNTLAIMKEAGASGVSKVLDKSPGDKSPGNKSPSERASSKKRSASEVDSESDASAEDGVADTTKNAGGKKSVSKKTPVSKKDAGKSAGGKAAPKKLSPRKSETKPVTGKVATTKRKPK